MEVLQKLVKYYRENKIAHAYLIETNNLNECYKELLNVIKQINCPNKFKNDCHECSICNLIDINNLPTLIVVSPDGNNIKKEQIIDLQQKFYHKPIYTKENIYIIKEAEKLNASSANTMLKFVEEPESNIIGFFITNNINNIIPTIKSRCEIIHAKYEKENDLQNYYDDALNYILKIELEKTSTILYNKNEILNNYSEKAELEHLLKEMYCIYNNILEETENIDQLNCLSHSQIINKLKILNKYINNLIYNVNLELFLDGLVIELSGLNNENV